MSMGVFFLFVCVFFVFFWCVFFFSFLVLWFGGEVFFVILLLLFLGKVVKGVIQGIEKK